LRRALFLPDLFPSAFLLAGFGDVARDELLRFIRIFQRRDVVAQSLLIFADFHRLFFQCVEPRLRLACSGS
jgi:hypothetical protein